MWQLLRPYLEEWMAAHTDGPSWQRELMYAAMRYEERRLVYINGEESARDDLLVSGDNWGAFVSDVDIVALFEAMYAGDLLT